MSHFCKDKKNRSLFNRRCYFLFFTAGANDGIVNSFIGAFEIMLQVITVEKGATTFLIAFNTFFF